MAVAAPQAASCLFCPLILQRVRITFLSLHRPGPPRLAAAFLAAFPPERPLNRSVIQHPTIKFKAFFTAERTERRAFYPIFMRATGKMLNFSSGFVSGWFFLCLLAVSHTLCKYLTSVLTSLRSVDKLMFHRGKGSGFF
ncbi:hypothetical protein ACFSFZ_02060 [Mixta tenebrionis]|uniref:Uncharacterized protein n=1 Tax=Mixta tenebrionis TaxID=2562439 RepID=A0A506VAA2_9GAMM|nr:MULTISPECIES: hypothetical protein [Mixta]TPW41913.1 hypothetical protein FKM52_11160 [Mixta tenebrionis]